MIAFKNNTAIIPMQRVIKKWKLQIGVALLMMAFKRNNQILSMLRLSKLKSSDRCCIANDGFKKKQSNSSNAKKFQNQKQN